MNKFSPINKRLLFWGHWSVVLAMGLYWTTIILFVCSVRIYSKELESLIGGNDQTKQFVIILGVVLSVGLALLTIGAWAFSIIVHGELFYRLWKSLGLKKSLVAHSYPAEKFLSPGLACFLIVFPLLNLFCLKFVLYKVHCLGTLIAKKEGTVYEGPSSSLIFNFNFLRVVFIFGFLLVFLSPLYIRFFELFVGLLIIFLMFIGLACYACFYTVLKSCNTMISSLNKEV